MTLTCAALEEQRHGRDLRRLRELVDEIRWISPDELPSETSVAVLGGLWLMNNVDRARDTLTRRARAGYSTIVVPRFRAGELGEVLGSPTAITVVSGEAGTVSWAGDGGTFAVSSVTSLETSLHNGHWASSETGLTVLGYRAHSGAGHMVVCTAALASRALGVEASEQRRLLERIFETLAPNQVVHEDAPAQEASTDSLSGFFDRHGPQAAAIALALVVAEGDRTADLRTVAWDRLGLSSDEAEFQRAVSAVPPAGVVELRQELEARGWGAHLRAVEREGRER